MRWGRGALVGWFIARVSRLRFPTLFLITATLFLVDLGFPDVIPLVDEILLGLGTALLGSWRRRMAPEAGGPPPRVAGRGP